MPSGRALRPLAAVALIVSVWVAAASGAVSTRLDSATPQAAAQASKVQLPNRAGSLKFGVLGDFGTGGREQYELARR